VYIGAEFENWGLTVQHTPSYTFVPTTVEGVKNLIKWAKAKGRRVRAAGYRHTWASMYSQDGEIFVSMLDLKTATAVPDPTSLLPSRDYTGNEFKVIELETQDVPGSGGKKRLARIGAAVVNEDFRRWAIANNAWTIALNVVMVEYVFFYPPTSRFSGTALTCIESPLVVQTLSCAMVEESGTRPSVIWSAGSNMSMPMANTKVSPMRSNSGLQPVHLAFLVRSVIPPTHYFPLLTIPRYRHPHHHRTRRYDLRGPSASQTGHQSRHPSTPGLHRPSCDPRVLHFSGARSCATRLHPQSRKQLLFRVVLVRVPTPSFCQLLGQHRGPKWGDRLPNIPRSIPTMGRRVARRRD